MGALVTPIPNQYAKEGVAYSYTFPSGTFSGTNTFRAFVNRLSVERALPSWLTFTDNADGTGTFSGTPTKWWELETLQIVVQATEGLTNAFSIFILTVGAADNTGRICWRAGTTPDHIINSANLSTFDASVVTSAQWVAIAEDVTQSISQALRDKVTVIRANGGFIVWLWSNTNGLKAHLTNYFDFDIVEAGETIAINGANGATRAFNPYGRLWRGLRGKEIYVTNYDAPVTVTSRNWQDYQNVAAIRCNRAEPPNDHMQDKYIRFIGQPNNHVPFVNLHGIKLREGITWQIDGSQGYIEAAFIDVIADPIGFHWKANLTMTRGDRRPSRNEYGWDMNQEHTYIHDCVGTTAPEGTEMIYLGGGPFDGMDISNGDHRIRRYGNTHRYIRIEHNDFRDLGWDGIQIRCVIGDCRVMYNHVYRVAIASDVNTAQAEGIQAENASAEIAYNYIEYAFFSPLRTGMLGLDSIHHNICVNSGQDNYGNPNLSAPNQGTGIYQNDRGRLNTDRPQIFIQRYSLWSSATTYGYDTTTSANRVRYNNKAYRSLQSGNTNHQPDISPTWWQDTHEGDSYNARPDLVEADLFHKVFNNTFVTGEQTIRGGVGIPAAQKWYQNNLFINHGETTASGGSGTNSSHNIAEIGVTLAAYFADPTNKDFRLLSGVTAEGAGINVNALIDPDYFTDGFLDFCGQPHAATPSVGAIEAGSPIGDHLVFALNGLYTGGGGGGNPAPITIEAGDDVSVALPIPDGITRTAVKSDPGRALSSTLWEQTSGPNTLTLQNANTLTVTATGFIAGTYSLRITIVDTYGQISTDSFSIFVSQIEVYSAFQWYQADDASGTNKALIQGANSIEYTPTTGLNKWFQRGETPVAKSGTILGVESLSNWVNVP